MSEPDIITDSLAEASGSSPAEKVIDPKENKAFIFYKDWEDIFDCFDDSEVGLLIRAVLAYARRGEKAFLPRGLDVAYVVMTNTIDRDNEKYVKKCLARSAAGKASAEKRKQQNAASNADGTAEKKKKKKGKDKLKLPVDPSSASPEAPEVSSNVGDGGDVPAEPKAYGEFKHVLLTDEQYNKLVEDFGEKKIAEYIRRVDEYIQQSGKSYRDFSLTIRKWIYDDAKLSKSGGAVKGENASLPDISKIEALMNAKYRA